ncbi:hypothetical protein MKW98_017215 [Papaver atlanticum]|uniref:Salutaridinol 7-O-acetyltransferase n=1 Tax=Papaver atlanticum TaxID=357466 RepID=A0AAD4SDH4_9MAGN|nr:hypothetical protein MKW98_017215 [Papaver atlanticum]
MSPTYVPIILFYPVTVAERTVGKHHGDLDLLKRSLSETLVHFYPMAGRLKDNIVVNCNDEGIEFFEVKIKAKMCDFMMIPDVPLSLLLPSEVVSMNVVKQQAQVIVQVNMFDCGGTAICLCISHKIADACTMSTFIRNWAGNTRTARLGGVIDVSSTNQNFLPSFDSASLFPPNEQLASSPGTPPTPVSYPKEDSSRDRILSKRFVFDTVKITSVREKLQVLMHENCKFHRPTRVEVVSALIWKAAMKSAPTGSLLKVNHIVNFRKKMNPPLLDVSFGNLCGIVTVVIPAATTATKNTANQTRSSTSSEAQEGQLTEFLAQLRGEINKVKGDKGCIQKIFLSCIGGYEDSTVKNSDVEDEALTLWMSSWCNFGFYDVDFGWGKPIWVTSDLLAAEPNKNMIFMIDTKCGEGIEVWAKFLEDDMAKFELHLSEILELF